MTLDEIKAMSPQTFKVFENRLRRMADRQGMQLRRSRTRDPRATSYGTYMLVDPATNSATHGENLQIDDVESILVGPTYGEAR